MQCPFHNDLIGAQILALVAFFISLAGWWLAWLSGLLALIILWLGCCFTFNSNIWLAVAVLAGISAVGELLVAISVVDKNVYCNDGGCGVDDVWFTVLSIVSLIMWLVVAGICFSTHRRGRTAGNTASDLPR